MLNSSFKLTNLNKQIKQNKSSSVQELHETFYQFICIEICLSTCYKIQVCSCKKKKIKKKSSYKRKAHCLKLNLLSLRTEEPEVSQHTPSLLAVSMEELCFALPRGISDALCQGVCPTQGVCLTV